MSKINFTVDGPEDLSKLQAAVAIWMYTSSSKEQRDRYLDILKNDSYAQFENLASQLEAAFNHWDADNK